MSLRLAPYPAYKESDVSWLGAIPDHWTAAPVRRYCRVFAGATPSRAVTEFWDGGTIPWLASGDVNLRRIDHASQFITEAGFAASSTKWIRPRSLIIALAGQGRTKGMVATVEMAATCNQSLAVVEPSPSASDHRFLAYYLESHYREIRGLVGDDLRDGLNLDHVSSIPTSLPPLDEQQAIVTFLDQADRRINRLIRAKRRLIELLNEQKQAIIHRAVTRGLDPNVRLKPSGIDWLGDVPEHWSIVQMRSLAKVVRGSSPRPAGSPELFHGSFIPWITVGELTKDGDSDLLTTTTCLTEEGSRRSRTIQPGTVLLTNSGATLGVPKISRIEGCINDGVAAFLSLRDAVSPQFLCLYWSTQTTHLRAWVDLGAQPNLNTQIIGGWPIALAPRPEQDSIVDSVTKEATVIAQTVSRAQAEIALLREYRTRLIADVVTGKLDVRGVELPPLDDDAALDDTEAPDEDAAEAIDDLGEDSEGDE